MSKVLHVEIEAEQNKVEETKIFGSFSREFLRRMVFICLVPRVHGSR